ncbi:MAG: gamma-glutamylcyclotransferase [Alphaproteobacteria bacterium]|nr:gamma-glutamylcyclotransferase [Alphaproteobacteria bacterium]
MAGDPPSDDDKNCTHKLTRESVLSGDLRRLLERRDPSVRVIPDEEHCASVATILTRHPEGGGDVWLFAYGSLIWNPMIHYVDKRVATVHGYHRRFCLWTHLGRGSADAPGLILGLDRGGACRGLAYRIEASIAQAELELLWRREMVTGSYCPRWVRIVTKEGGRGWAITFIINRAHQRYAGPVPEDRMVESIAKARGALGPCAVYLFDTARHLEALGIRDESLFRLRDRVAQVLEGQKKNPE